MTMFVITQQHLDLLKRMYVKWGSGEYGAPAISSKRPYGNSDVEDDICEILKCEEKCDCCDERFSEEDMEDARMIHKETKTALQICLCTQSFKAGLYEQKKDYCDTSWVFIKE